MAFADELWANGGDVGRDLAEVDWTSTPLGPPESWPPSLCSAIRIVLTSKFSMWMAWGPELTFFCNDAYRRDTLANKYPWALGRPASEVWAEIWEDIGPRIDHVLQTGEATWDESLQLFLERSGYVEETYHTFSYSPLADDEGVIVGMLCVVKEDTAQVIANRRMRTLRDLGARPTGLDEAGAIHAACRRLAGDPRSLPFTLVYVFDHEAGQAHLAGTSGIEPGRRASPTTIDVGHDREVWPAAAALSGEVTRIDGLRGRFSDLPTGAWDDPPDQAFVVPLLQPAQPLPYGFLVASINPYRRGDDAFEGFVTLLAAQLAAIISDARAFEFERQRAETLAQLDQAKTDFFTSVSHEFRTPLTLLLGPAEESLNDTVDPLSETHRSRTLVIHRNALRLLKLVNNLLDFSRLQSSVATARFDPVDLAQYTTELVSMFESAATRGDVELVIACEPLPAPVYVDQEQWAKVVLNLVSNALKFTFDGSIEVRLRTDGDHVLLTVADTGSGIPADELPRLFERFHRVRGATGRTNEGSGIGLALVAEITAMHGGTVDVESKLGAGSTFTVRIPFGDDHLPDEQVGGPGALVDPAQQARSYVSEALSWLDRDVGDSSTSAAGPAEGHPGPDLPRVLVVDDNDDMREYVASLLRPTYAITTAVDGLDALAKVAERTPDLVITDVMMPNLDGFGLVSRLHEQPATTGVPVIMLSARAGDDGVVEGLEAGADDYLVKPFSSRELLARVAVNLELDRMRRVRSTLERSQDLIDQAQRLAKVGTWEIDVAADRLRGSEELYRILGVTADHVRATGYEALVRGLVHPDDVDEVVRALGEVSADAVTRGVARIRTPAGDERILQAWVEAVTADDGREVIRGSVQDITEQRELERSLAESLAKEEAAAREHAIAEYLQRSLMPEQTFDLERLQVATYYRAGVEGTQVGGDWYDVFELGAGRVALVIGDVMGRGVPAASVMGQMRSAVRTLGKLDLSPGELIEQLDAFVGDLEGYQMVTCVYAVFDSIGQTLTYANAGHVPPFVGRSGGEVAWLDATSPPLGAGKSAGSGARQVRLQPDTRLVLYTDGLVEQRGQDLGDGIHALEQELLAHADEPVDVLPEQLVAALRPEGPDDDVALLVCQVDAAPYVAALTHEVTADETRIADTRRVVEDQLRTWGLDESTVSDVSLTTHELVANAMRHGHPPVQLRVVHTGSQLLVEVRDRSTDRPRRRDVHDSDEHGRGLQLVAALASDWGVRVRSGHKVVWASHALSSPSRAAR